LSDFSGFIYNSKDILLAKLSAIQHGLKLAINMGIEELVCYSDSLLSINLIFGVTSQFHIYVVLIQDIKDLLTTRSFSIQHTLREGNQCADFMAKLGVSTNAEFNLQSILLLQRIFSLFSRRTQWEPSSWGASSFVFLFSSFFFFCLCFDL